MARRLTETVFDLIMSVNTWRLRTTLDCLKNL